MSNKKSIAFKRLSLSNSVKIKYTVRFTWIWKE